MNRTQDAELFELLLWIIVITNDYNIIQIINIILIFNDNFKYN